MLRHDLGIDQLYELRQSELVAIPHEQRPLRARQDRRVVSADLEEFSPSAPLVDTGGYARAYREGRVDPVEVTERTLSAARWLAAARPSLGPVLDYDDERAFEAARASAERIRQGEALSELDGVPMLIKEELSVAGLPKRIGTAFLPNVPQLADAVAVARLRQAGAVILGTSPMSELGMSPLGGNVHRDMPRNAHDPERLPGGSSSGSAVAVATGLLPTALGTDGGGSVRIPACHNGVFGLKPTFGRIPCTGAGGPGGSSVVHIGPISVSVRDLALFTEVTAGADAGDTSSGWQPPLARGNLVAALRRRPQGIRVGVIESEWEVARQDAAAPARAALASLEAEGATLVPLRVPLAAHAAAIGYLTIGLETYAYLQTLGDEQLAQVGPDLELLLASLRQFGSHEYLFAQRARQTLRHQVVDALREVDAIALPSTLHGASRITDEEAEGGFVDPPELDAACRFMFLGNVTGLPAATAPVGRDREGMPVGLQIIGDAWDEATVLTLLAALERSGAARVERPARAVEPLSF
jgi:aspartyl-tRNA(Asn)/glutamyl-tRNA(Gln) amidotransferase subunit A